MFANCSLFIDILIALFITYYVVYIYIRAAWRQNIAKIEKKISNLLVWIIRMELGFMVFNTTFNIISVISWLSVLLTCCKKLTNFIV